MDELSKYLDFTHTPLPRPILHNFFLFCRAVDDMTGLFRDHCSSVATFDEDISGWVVENVEYMDGMFENAAEFNQNIGSWDGK